MLHKWSHDHWYDLGNNYILFIYIYTYIYTYIYYTILSIYNKFCAKTLINYLIYVPIDAFEHVLVIVIRLLHSEKNMENRISL